jgi:hypothetical protein
MLETFIKNRGITKTIIHKNNQNKVNEVNWDADYDGKKANISLDLNTDGNEKHYDVQLTNDDLAKILNLNSVNKSLDERLLQDFQPQKNKLKKINPMIIEIENETPYNFSYANDTNELNELNEIKDAELDELFLNENKIDLPEKLTHISSPLQNEELLIPLTIGKSYGSLNKNKNKSHRVYKIHNSPKSKSNIKTDRKSSIKLNKKTNKKSTRRSSIKLNKKTTRKSNRRSTRKSSNLFDNYSIL